MEIRDAQTAASPDLPQLFDFCSQPFGIESSHNIADDSGLVDQDLHGDRLRTICAAYSALFIQQNRGMKFLLPHVILNLIPGFLEIDREEDQGIAVFLLKILDHRHGDAARPAPGSPEIEQYHFPLELIQGNLPAAQVRKLERRGRTANLESFVLR